MSSTRCTEKHSIHSVISTILLLSLLLLYHVHQNVYIYRARQNSRTHIFALSLYPCAACMYVYLIYVFLIERARETEREKRGKFINLRCAWQINIHSFIDWRWLNFYDVNDLRTKGTITWVQWLTWHGDMFKATHFIRMYALCLYRTPNTMYTDLLLSSSLYAIDVIGNCTKCERMRFFCSLQVVTFSIVYRISLIQKKN